MLTRVRDHLEEVGVPVWRDGHAAFDQTLYYRGIWAALALLAGLGSISLAVFSGGDVTLFHVVVPAALCALTAAFAFWQIVLIALSARRARSGMLALTAVAGSIAAVFAIAVLLEERAAPAVAELWSIYSGDEELDGLAVSVASDGRTLRIDGPYGVGSVDVVRRALEGHPSIRQVVLAGPGGRIGPAFEINRMIRNRGLATRVEAACASACTIAFLGGVDRSMSPSARLGFHQGSFPGMGSNDMYESNRDMKRFLIASGVAPDFAQRVIDTPADDIWVPTPKELLAGHVVHRVNR